MAVTLFSATNGTLPVNSETFIDVNETGVFTTHVDMDLMVDWDVLEWSVYQIALTGGTAVKIDSGAFYGADGGVPGLKAFHSDAYVNNLTDAQGLRFSYNQILASGGIGRALPRKVLKIA